MACEFMRTDAMLMEILQERKSVTGFLDAIFGFLRRNTDFYHIKKDKTERIGFPKGVREQILFGAMQRYDPDCDLNNLASEDINEDMTYVPPAAKEVEIETETQQQSKELTVKTNINQKKKIATECSEFVTSDYKNGSKFEHYCWSQTLKDVEIQIKIPPGIVAKDLKIELKSDSICVGSRSMPEKIVFNGKLSNKYKHNDALWTISEGKLIISFDKVKEMWWERLLETEDSVDIKKLDSECFINDLPEESQAQIHKLRIQQMEGDQMQSEISREKTETIDKLRKAWDAEDSPFRGQPFDPSIVKFS